MHIIDEASETLEDLQLNGLRLIQKKESFRFGMDSVLLADFADICEKDTVADLGTGNGVLILLLHGRNKGNRYFALDIQEEAAELTKRNMELNGLQDKTCVFCMNAANAAKRISPCTVDKVICNPPYSHTASALPSPVHSRAVARTQADNTLDCFLKGSFQILKGKGKLYMVYPAAQMLDLMKKLQQHHLEPKRFRLVYPFVSKPANLVLIEAQKDAKPTLRPCPPLIIYEEEGILTNELKSVYHIL